MTKPKRPPEIGTLCAECGFCYPSEQGKHGEIKREWSDEFTQHIAVCRRHSLDASERDTRILFEGRTQRRGLGRVATDDY